MNLVVQEEGTESPFRKRMDELEKERRPQVLIPDVASWNEVPSDLKTKSQWKRNGRRVPKETPARLFKVGDDSWSRRIPFYSLDQTRPYKPSTRTRAFWRYCNIFHRNSNKHDYIYKRAKDWSGEDEPEWSTQQISEDSGLNFDFRTLSESTLRTHVNHRNVVGVKNRTGRTNWISIDLDLHNRNEGVFLKQAGVLLERFHGGTWHYQVKDQDVTGIHFLLVFKEPKDLEFCTRKLRRMLQKLDSQNPQLAEEARNNGMKTLGELEIYPTRNHGFRLPLAKGRILMLDRHVKPIQRGQRLVGDLETYINWLDDPHRKHMPREHVLQYLQTFISMDPHKHSRQKPALTAGESSATWRNRTKRNLIEFWREGNSNHISLNEHIIVLARLSYFWGYRGDQIELQINRMLRNLPASAFSSSSRLLKRDWKNIARVVKSSVKYAQDNLHQKDPEPSTTKLTHVAQNFKKSAFDPLKPETWRDTFANPEPLPVTWLPKEKNRLIAFLRKPLFCRNDQLIVKFVEEVIGLTQKMKNRPWGLNYFSKWANSRFPALKMKRKNKLVEVLRILREEKVIFLDQQGSKGRGSSRWSLGVLSQNLLNRSRKQSSTNLFPSEYLGKGWSPSAPNQSFSFGATAVKKDYQQRIIPNTYKAIYRRAYASIYLGITFEPTHTNLAFEDSLSSSGPDPPG